MRTEPVPIVMLVLIVMTISSACAYPVPTVVPALVPTPLPSAAPTPSTTFTPLALLPMPATVPTSTPTPTSPLPTATLAPPTMPPAPPTATVVLTEVIASKAEDVDGIWTTRYAPIGGDAFIEYKADGTWVVAKTVTEFRSSPTIVGSFKFEGTQFVTDDWDCGKGTYEVRVRKDGSKRVELTFDWIDDPCRPRRSDLGRGMSWAGP